MRDFDKKSIFINGSSVTNIGKRVPFKESRVKDHIWLTKIVKSQEDHKVGAEMENSRYS